MIKHRVQPLYGKPLLLLLPLLPMQPLWRAPLRVPVCRCYPQRAAHGRATSAVVVR